MFYPVPLLSIPAETALLTFASSCPIMMLLNIAAVAIACLPTHTQQDRREHNITWQYSAEHANEIWKSRGKGVSCG